MIVIILYSKLHHETEPKRLWHFALLFSMFIFCWPCGFFGRYYKSLLIFHPSSFFFFYQSVFPKPSSLQKVLYMSNWKNISVISRHPIIMCFTTCLAISLSLSPLSVSIIIGYRKCLKFCTMSMSSPHRFTFIFWHCFLKHARIICCEVLNKYLLNMTSKTDYYFYAPCVVFHWMLFARTA